LFGGCFLFISLATLSSSSSSAVRASGPPGSIRQITNPFIIEHPDDQYVARNDPATLNCKAEGRPDPIITWYRNGQPVVTANENPAVDRMLLPSGQLLLMKVSPAGKTGRPTDVGVYYCNATNPETGFSVVSRNATLDIAVMRDEFREEPTDAEVAVGHVTVLRCRPPRAEPEPRVYWTKDNSPLPLLRTSSTAAGGDGSTDRIYVDETGNLHVTDARRDDAGSYECVAQNVAGERHSRSARLVVREKPRIVDSPKDIVAKENSDVTFHCRATGDPQPTVIWNKLDGQIAAERASITADRMLQIRRVQISDDGVYVCRVENSVGWREAEARLTVQSPPSFIVTPTDKTVGVGRQISFRCEVIGNPAPAVFWNRESSETFMFPNQDHGRLSVLDDGSLTISSVHVEDSGVYVCQGLNMAGTAIAKVKLQVKDTDTRLPPFIVHGPQNQTLPVGGTATLLCSTAGEPPPDVYWFRNGRVLTSIGREPRFTIIDTGTLLISDLRRTDSGMYICQASSETGTTSSEVAFLTVDSPSTNAVVFHRSPQPSAFPNPPGRPTVSDVTNTTARLTWKPHANTGASPIVGYAVEYFGHETGLGWILAGDMIPEPAYIVRGLRPGTSYVFVVRSHNSHGRSGPSSTSNSITTRGDGVVTTKLTTPSTPSPLPEIVPVPTERFSGAVVIRSVTAEPISATALRLSWQLLPWQGVPAQQRQLVDGYHVRYRRIDDEGSTDSTAVDYAVRTVRPGDVNEFVLTGLEPFTFYDIYLQPFYRLAEGAPSVVIRSRTLEDVPSMAPMSVHAAMLDNSTLKISWKQPPKQSQNGHLLGYRIYVHDNVTRLSQEIEVNSSVESIVVYHLATSVTFTVQVSAFNRRGEGVRSEPVIAGGDQTVASAVRRPVVDEPWFLVVLVGAAVSVISVISCIILVVICQRYAARRKLSKQAIISVPEFKFHESERIGLRSQLTSVPDGGWTGRPRGPLPPTNQICFAPATGDVTKVPPRCYSNETRASDGESHGGSSHGNSNSRGNNNGGGHYYYTLQSPVLDVNTDADDDVSGGVDVFNDDERPSTAGTPALFRPIPQSYMIRPSAPTLDDQRPQYQQPHLTDSGEDSFSGVASGRRHGSLPKRPVLFLPPPPSHAPYDSVISPAPNSPAGGGSHQQVTDGQPHRQLDRLDDIVTSRGLGSTGNGYLPNAVPGACCKPQTNHQHHLKPELKWTPISVAAGADNDDGSEIEDSGTGMWNGDADESSCDALATDYEDGTSSCASIERYVANAVGAESGVGGRWQPSQNAVAFRPPLKFNRPPPPAVGHRTDAILTTTHPS
jgi:roundabout axon guidance receptor 2